MLGMLLFSLVDRRWHIYFLTVGACVRDKAAEFRQSTSARVDFHFGVAASHKRQNWYFVVIHAGRARDIGRAFDDARAFFTLPAIDERTTIALEAAGLYSSLQHMTI